MEIIPRPRSCFLCIGNRSFKGFRLSFIRTVGCKTSCIWSQISSVRLIDDSLTNRKERTKIGNNYSSWKHPVWSTTRIDFRTTIFWNLYMWHVLLTSVYAHSQLCRWRKTTDLQWKIKIWDKVIGSISQSSILLV